MKPKVREWAGHFESLPILHYDLMLAVAGRNDFLDLFQAYDCGSTDSGKMTRTKLLFHSRHSTTYTIMHLSGMDKQVIAFCLNPVDFLRLEKYNSRRVLNNQPVQGSALSFSL